MHAAFQVRRPCHFAILAEIPQRYESGYFVCFQKEFDVGCGRSHYPVKLPLR